MDISKEEFEIIELISKFGMLMRTEMLKHIDDKKHHHWHVVSIHYLIYKLHNHIYQYQYEKSFEESHYIAIESKRHLIHIANYCMMLYDKVDASEVSNEKLDVKAI